MNTDRSQALFFLMSLGALPACVVGDDADTDTDASTNPTSTPTTGVDTSDGMTMTTAMTMTTEDPTGTTDPGTTGVDPDTGTTSLDPDTGTGTTAGYQCGAVPEVCNTFAAKYVECYPKYGKYQEYAANACACAIYYGSTYGENCATAYNDLYACLSVLACEDFMARDACSAENAAVEVECFGGGSESSGG
jgi:hypothetical protein